ncbi:hypothetical protein HS041_01135 [Planomonospora sp. ID67723]|nr:hypothetical protein [Planomonospora sp. ID67723]MBG0826387.1 hypothetical protein [Planomonospora sp. ID67723]
MNEKIFLMDASRDRCPATTFDHQVGRWQAKEPGVESGAIGSGQAVLLR